MPEIKILENEPLAPLSTWKIGGNARFFTRVKTVNELREALLFSQAKSLTYFILGKGSNCLFDSKGFSGLVILNQIHFLEEEETLFHVGAAYPFSLLGLQSARKGYGGLEFASGIPASVGGAIFMNAGANGMETKDCLVSVDFLDEHGFLRRFKKEELEFSYRFSSFQRWKGAIVSASFCCEKDLGARERQLAIIDYRKQSQPLGEASCGCVFRNPRVDLSAAKLIDDSGLKGLSVGGVSVSEKHANFLLNRGHASSDDVRDLVRLIKERVLAKHGCYLEDEVRYLPYEG